MRCNLCQILAAELLPKVMVCSRKTHTFIQEKPLERILILECRNEALGTIAVFLVLCLTRLEGSPVGQRNSISSPPLSKQMASH